MNAVLACLDAHLAAENAHDLDGIMATYGAEPRVTINGQDFLGTDKVSMFHRRFGFGGDGGFSQVTVRERRRHSAGERVVVLEQTLSGTHSGTWQGVAPTRRSFAVPVCTVYTFDADAKLQSEDVYFDAAAMQRQLGIGAA